MITFVTIKSGTFAPDPLPPTYTITATAYSDVGAVNTGGTITPSGHVVVNEGDDQSFSIAAWDGYLRTR